MAEEEKEIPGRSEIGSYRTVFIKSVTINFVHYNIGRA